MIIHLTTSKRSVTDQNDQEPALTQRMASKRSGEPTFTQQMASERSVTGQSDHKPAFTQQMASERSVTRSPPLDNGRS